MTIQTLPEFRHFTTKHCVTGSMRHIYQYNHAPISEELLLGLGNGVGFIYWHTKGSLPFLGGRANAGRPGEEGLERLAGQRTGVRVESWHTSSTNRAEQDMLKILNAGQPVMLRVDMGFLPYLDFQGQEYHFGYHVIVVCGVDHNSGQVLIADRDEPLHPVTLADLATARGSRFQPFPPQNICYRFDFSGYRLPCADEVLQAIRECARTMLHPPINNLGVKGIYKAAQRIDEWPKLLAEETLVEACLNTAIMIDARGGSGGGLFRFMYAEFLRQASVLTSRAQLNQVADQFDAMGALWQQAADSLFEAYQKGEAGDYLKKVSVLLQSIAGLEQKGWEFLASIAV